MSKCCTKATLLISFQPPFHLFCLGYYCTGYPCSIGIEFNSVEEVQQTKQRNGTLLAAEPLRML